MYLFLVLLYNEKVLDELLSEKIILFKVMERLFFEVVIVVLGKMYLIVLLFLMIVLFFVWGL